MRSENTTVSAARSRVCARQYLLYYDNGKSAVRLSPGVACKGVHAFRHEGKALTALLDARNMELGQRIDCADPCILHYVVCGSCVLAAVCVCRS